MFNESSLLYLLSIIFDHILQCSFSVPSCMYNNFSFQSKSHCNLFEDILMTINFKPCGTDNAHNSAAVTAEWLWPRLCLRRQWQHFLTASDFGGVKKVKKMCPSESATYSNTSFKVLFKDQWGLFPFLCARLFWGAEDHWQRWGNLESLKGNKEIMSWVSEHCDTSYYPVMYEVLTQS